MVDLPAPERPTKPIFSPGRMVSVSASITAFDTGVSLTAARARP